MAEVIFEPEFFSVQSFVLSESVSLPLLWVHALSTPCSREGGSRGPMSTVPRSSFPSSADCHFIPVARSLCPFVLETWVRGGNRELWGKKVILLLRCSMLICEKSGLLHWMVPEEKWQMNCAAWSSKDGIGWAVEEDRELEA